MQSWAWIINTGGEEAAPSPRAAESELGAVRAGNQEDWGPGSPFRIDLHRIQWK